MTYARLHRNPLLWLATLAALAGSSAVGCSDDDDAGPKGTGGSSAGSGGTGKGGSGAGSSGMGSGGANSGGSGGAAMGGAAGHAGGASGASGAGGAGAAGAAGEAGSGGAAGEGGQGGASGELPDGSLCIAGQSRCLAAAKAGEAYDCNGNPHSTTDQNTALVAGADASQVAVGGSGCELVDAWTTWRFTPQGDGTYRISTLDGAYCLAAAKQGSAYTCFDNPRTVDGQRPASLIPCGDSTIAVGGSACTEPEATLTWRISKVAGEYRIATPDDAMCLVTPSEGAAYTCFDNPRTVTGQTVASIVGCDATTVAVGGSACTEPAAVLTWVAE